MPCRVAIFIIGNRGMKLKRLVLLFACCALAACGRKVIETPKEPVYGTLSVTMTSLPSGCSLCVESEFGTEKADYAGEKDGTQAFSLRVPFNADRTTLSLVLPDGRPLFVREITDELSGLEEGKTHVMDEVDAVLAEIDYVEERYGGSNSISFMHISDTHMFDTTLNKFVGLVQQTDVPFSVITGDMYFNNAQVKTVRSSAKPIYLVPGNHDIYHYYGGWRAAGLKPFEPNYCFRYEQLDHWFAGNLADFSHYGSEKACYFYFDFKAGDKTLRLIGLDQYDGGTAGWNERNDIIISQEEADWLADLLGKSENVDGIIIFIHAGFGNANKGQRNTDNEGEFISTTAGDFPRAYSYNGIGDPYLVPEIVQAYISGQNLDKKEFRSGAAHRDDGSTVPPETTVTVTTHFTQPHKNFIAYLGGHLHWDMVEYLKDFPQQLQVLIANGFKEKIYTWHDLSYEDASYTINYCVVNFDTKTFVIHRIGSRKTDSGTYRLEQTFPFGK